MFPKMFTSLITYDVATVYTHQGRVCFSLVDQQLVIRAHVKQKNNKKKKKLLVIAAST